MKTKQQHDRQPIVVDIAICTFRREELRKTLASVASLVVPEATTIRIIVADNDIEPSARERVALAAEYVPFPISYIHCPASNISLARNACLDASTGDFLAFIDDDEVAMPDWLCELVATVEASKADVVLGPVRALYQSNAPSWMSHGDFHSTRPVWVRGEICTGYTCNVLLRRTADGLLNHRFNLALGLTGGEDTEFFSHLHRAGSKIAYAEKAWVEEPVPVTRARLSWLVKRRFRFGQTHGRLLQENIGGWQRLSGLGVAAAKMIFCAGLSAMLCLSPRHGYRYALRGIMHAGVVGGLLGVRESRQYGVVGSQP